MLLTDMTGNTWHGKPQISLTDMMTLEEGAVGPRCWVEQHARGIFYNDLRIYVCFKKAQKISFSTYVYTVTEIVLVVQQKLLQIIFKQPETCSVHFCIYN